ncbi:hypothetical protein [Fictibacillus sp. JL2B1089]|uniref:hypothetical protein n=1 Tax=Fictibacillus sp. JL2B1089 TaxID=3399565 RepID=UPI003A89F4A9
MKVFKMNDCDWVAAETEEQAKSFYANQTGFDLQEEINPDFEGEVSLNDTMFIGVNELPEEELLMPQETTKYGNELYVSRSFHWVIEKDKITEPCIISSTEF